MREEIQLNQKPETGILSSLYSYIALAAGKSFYQIDNFPGDYITFAQRAKKVHFLFCFYFSLIY
jgi:hypothetical protein